MNIDLELNLGNNLFLFLGELSLVMEEHFRVRSSDGFKKNFWVNYPDVLRVCHNLLICPCILIFALKDSSSSSIFIKKSFPSKIKPILC